MGRGVREGRKDKRAGAGSVASCVQGVLRQDGRSLQAGRAGPPGLLGLSGGVQAPCAALGVRGHWRGSEGPRVVWVLPPGVSSLALRTQRACRALPLSLRGVRIAAPLSVRVRVGPRCAAFLVDPGPGH